jgi:hypothetical protein
MMGQLLKNLGTGAFEHRLPYPVSRLVRVQAVPPEDRGTVGLVREVGLMRQHHREEPPGIIERD